MDKTTTLLAEYALSQTHDNISSAEIAAGVRHNLDGVGCAAGAFGSAPCRIARELAAEVTSKPGCSVYGLAQPSSPEHAACDALLQPAFQSCGRLLRLAGRCAHQRGRREDELSSVHIHFYAGGEFYCGVACPLGSRLSKKRPKATATA